jgi:hypothetical protein
LTFDDLRIRYAGVHGADSAKKSHKTTLFHTVDHFRGWQDSGQALSNQKKGEIMNEIKDLAPTPEPGSSKKIAVKLDT